MQGASIRRNGGRRERVYSHPRPNSKELAHHPAVPLPELRSSGKVLATRSQHPVGAVSGRSYLLQNRCHRVEGAWCGVAGV